MYNRSITLLLAGMFVVITSGCGIAYSRNRTQLLKTSSEADFGPPPPANHQDLEAQLIRGSLKDPESARFEFGTVVRDAIPSKLDGITYSTTPILVWIASLRVNARNSFGGYVGFTPYSVAWREGRIVAYGELVANCTGSDCVSWRFVK